MGLRGQNSPGGPFVLCLWLVLWSSRCPQVLMPRKSNKNRENRPLFKRKAVDLWSCWADLNRRPHPYQATLELFQTIFNVLWSYSLRLACFPSLFKKKVSACSVAVCGWLCGQSAEGEDFRDFDRLHKYGQITVFLTCRSTFAVVLTKNLHKNFFFILIAECFANTNQLPSQKLMR